MALYYILLLSSSIFKQIGMSSWEFETFFEANKCVMLDEDFVQENTSYHGCFKQCKLRAGCVAVNYMQKMSLCRLNFEETNTVQCEGYVYSRKSDWDQDGFAECSCASGQICLENGNCATSGKVIGQEPITNKCIPSMLRELNMKAAYKCNRLHRLDKGQIYGNRFGIGDKGSFKCNPGYIYNGTTNRVCTASATWSGKDGTCVKDPTCKNYLVGGPNGVNDGQLSESDYWCKNYDCPAHFDGPADGASAKYAKLNMTGLVTGGWILPTGPASGYVQVNFLFVRTISAIALQSRYYMMYQGTFEILQYVTSFNVLTSIECVSFTTITDDTGNDKLFEGNSTPEEIVIRDLPETVRAQCVRILPVAWFGWNSLRFDVLGC